MIVAIEDGGDDVSVLDDNVVKQLRIIGIESKREREREEEEEKEGGEAGGEEREREKEKGEKTLSCKLNIILQLRPLLLPFLLLLSPCSAPPSSFFTSL